MNNRKFFQNAVLMTGTGLVLRAAGLLLRVLLANVLGEEGMGLYSLTFTVYNLFITLAQSGIAAAVTRLVAQYLALKQPGKAKGALRGCLKWSAILGGGACLVLFCGSEFLAARWIGNPGCAFALRMLAFSLPFMAVSGCYNGYFVSRREVKPGCLSQLLEQAVRMAIVTAAVLLFRDQGFSMLLGMVVLANTVSEGVSCLFLAAVSRKKPLTVPPEKAERGSIRRIALPVAASRYLSTALHTTENMLIPMAIARYTGDYSIGLAQFGALKGMAIPLLFFPASFLTALSSLLVPEVTDTSAREDWRSTRSIVGRALGITLALSVMIGGVFFLYGDLLGQVLFRSDTVSMMLRVLAPITPFMYMDTIADGLLKGLDRQSKALRNNTIDSTLRILLITFAVPLFGIRGFLGVMVFSNILVASLNMGTLLRACRLSFQWKDWLLRPLAAVGLATAVWALLPLRGSIWRMILGTAFWCAVYLLFYWLTLPEKNSIMKSKDSKEVKKHETTTAGLLR
ncbi:MAG: oligosaccharide flippase family protein [Clostridia bacterium]|nr:oligosaccharide flippase family protein [Clostridia bacterium]